MDKTQKRLEKFWDSAFGGFGVWALSLVLGNHPLVTTGFLFTVIPSLIVLYLSIKLSVMECRAAREVEKDLPADLSVKEKGEKLHEMGLFNGPPSVFRMVVFLAAMIAVNIFYVPDVDQR